jgi:hypothetical protein
MGVKNILDRLYVIFYIILKFSRKKQQFKKYHTCNTGKNVNERNPQQYLTGNPPNVRNDKTGLSNMKDHAQHA